MKKTLRDRFIIIYKNLALIMFFTILISGGVYYYYYNANNTYSTTSTLLVTNPGDNTINNLIVHLKSNDVINQISKDLDDEFDRESLNSIIEIIALEDTDLISIRSTTDDMEDSKLINDTFIEVASVEVLELYTDVSFEIIETSEFTTKETSIDENIITAITASIAFLTLSLFLSFFGSVETKIKNHEDLKKLLNLKSLGIVPNKDDVEHNIGKKKTETNITMINNPNSMISESYRMLRTNLDFLDLKTINITSTTSGEGKSDLVANLALSFSLIGKKLLVIDCDLRKPVVHKSFNVNRSLGLSDIVLYNRVDDYKNMIQKFTVSEDISFDILSAGSKISNTSELLNSNRFKTLIEKSKNDYDLVILDCPPVSLMTDAAIVSKIVDGTVFVVEYNRINYAAINSVLEQLSDVDARIMGGVITKIDIKKQKKLYGNKYDYYDNYM